MGDKNLTLVKSIEKFPCLYNHHCIDYSKKEVTDIAWNVVANETKLTVAECREKWKNLRYGFIRSLRPNPDGSSKKKYYLHDDMEFVLPFIKFLSKSSQMPATNLEIDTDDDINDYTTDKGQSPQFEYDNLFQNAEPLRKKIRLYEPDRINDARKMFLLSLLPEVNELTENQMKCFRRKVLALLDEIVDNIPDQSEIDSNDCIIKREYE
ncbi:unnamed protein product [Chilo suppressalis]|uniref:MADF domain-containing protein n=1 Tax=Chilo suppressalis TaxID=168631 RepID=A0ABN8AVX9_CHISP|nr:hypothetical protein evm_007366 [Chilo suppressalis]CAH0399468.1 unnamed protein product [Chilo suppressalis]